METRNPPLTRLLPIVVLLVMAVVVTVALWRAFGGSVPLEPKGYRVETVLPHASNLHPHADVRISGVDVGKVVGVHRDDGRARVELEIEARYAPLPSDTRVMLRSKTLLGEAYLELTPGSPGSPRVPEGGALPARQSVATQRLDDVLQTFGPSTRADLRDLLGGLAGALAGREAQLNSSLGRLAPITADLDTVASELARQRVALATLVDRSGGIFAVLGRRQGAMRAAIEAGNRLLGTTSRRSESLAATVRELPGFLREADGSFARLGAASADLEGAVDALEPSVPVLRPALAAIREEAPSFRRLFKGLPGVIAAGRRGMPPLTRILEAAGPALTQVYPASRELIPVFQLMGLVRDSITLTLANVGQIHGGYMVGAGNRVTNYVPGVITLWNETIAGWVKRLPTHRGNAYPKPGFLEDIGRYKSYDCRHTGNPLVVPALGAAPPCVTQGPWTFNGVTAYYPRLRRAPR